MKQIIFLLIIALSFSCCKKPPIGTQQNNQTQTDEDKEDDDDEDTDKDKEYKRLRDRIKDKTDELEDIEYELEELEEKLSDDRLTPEERRRLETKKSELESEKSNLQTQITDLTGERDTARTERDCWKETRVSLCDRTQIIQTKVLEQVQPTLCADVNYCHLREIITLDLSGSFDPSSGDRCGDHDPDFKKTDFKGFTKLENLDLSGNCLSAWQHITRTDATFFSGLDSIKHIDLQETNIGRLHNNFFHGILDTLEDGKVYVNDFIYCSSGTGQSDYKNKLGITEGTTDDFAGTAAYARVSGFNADTYCYRR